MAEPKNKPVVNLASVAEGAEVKVTDDGTLPDRLRNMVRNPNAIGTHSAACWQWHDDCALLLAADRVAERDAERAGRERAEAEARQLRELLHDVWLYIDWRYVTKQLTTEQKGMFADAVDEHTDGGYHAADRWWPAVAEGGEDAEDTE